MLSLPKGPKRVAQVLRKALLVGVGLAGLWALLVSSKTVVRAQDADPDSQDLNIRAYIELLRSDVRAKKTAVMAEVMGFSDEEAAKFWPIYREYELELSKSNDRKLAGIKDYAQNYTKMTEQKAQELSDLALQLEADRVVLKQKYVERLRKALSPKVAARFLQVENQLLWLLDLQISSSLPVIQ